MKKIDLGGKWELSGCGFQTIGDIPGSVYSILLNNDLIEDTYYRVNEEKALALMDNEFTFVKKFDYHKKEQKVLLVCEGIDTLCDLYINDKFLSHTENMHRNYEFDISSFLIDGINQIKAVFPPLDKFIKKKYKNKVINGCSHPLNGFMYVRKAHYMLGWDWGPRTPDAGIWKPIYLLEGEQPRIKDVVIEQRHEGGQVYLTVNATADKDCEFKITLTSPNGQQVILNNNEEFLIKDAELWWPNGLGKQPLYEVSVKALFDGLECDYSIKKIGLRTLKLIKENDEHGETFCHEVNGVRFFAMGADYIPEDTILARCNKKRTKELLEKCVFSNFNTIRVWGGGYYPEDYFFEICDELGLVVFFDLMFACSFYDFGKEFSKNTLTEIEQNVRRFRHHACIGVISGNNEIEERFCWYNDAEVKEHYIDFFEGEVKQLMNNIAPNIAYVPSSPSSFGSGIDPRNERYGDSHYWDVWHANEPFTEYRNHSFRYLSEFGFQSFPCLKTIETFTLPEDRNVFSRVMEMHQRNYGANGKILSYLSQTYLYPNNIETLLYASQLLQADAIRCGVEHFRRIRGICMGTLYWQLNDCWPGASWSSIDYYGRLKALHYSAKRFFAPIAISCEETSEFTNRFDVTNERNIVFETKAKLFVSNETCNEIVGTIRWQLRNADSKILKSGEKEIVVPQLSVKSISEIDFNKTDVNENYLWYELVVENNVVSYGSVLFTKPKYFNFRDPLLLVSLDDNVITVKSKTYAKYVEIYSSDSDFVLSDNFFDMNKGEKKITVVSGQPKNLKIRSVYDIR